MYHLLKIATLIAPLFILTGCSESNYSISPLLGLAEQSEPEASNSVVLTNQLLLKIVQSTNEDPSMLRLPGSTQYSLIPQDISNPISAEKVALGQMLFHDTATATAGTSSESDSWSCATCHHAAAGFKSGIPQGIGEGGVGFGSDGSERRLSALFRTDLSNSNKPDLQPLTSPSILNSAYQDVTLWNGQFGNSRSGNVNSGIPHDILMSADTPKTVNALGLAGLEAQAIAGLDVHRMNVESEFGLQIVETYQILFNAAYADGSDNIKRDAGKAIAAFERTVLANRAPFQQWLNGHHGAMTDAEKRGGILFFGDAGCAECHQGPALSSKVGANESELFMALGFADFDPDNQELVHGEVSDADRKGRGGFTQDESDNYKFKIPQLYNLADTNVFGHGASFRSIREVIEYKNAGVVQNSAATNSLDQRFRPLGLSSLEMDDLEHFLKYSLYDDELSRYQPTNVPSGGCVVVDPLILDSNGFCQ